MLAHKKLQSGLLLALWNIFSVLYRRGIKMPNGVGSGVGDSYHSQTSLPPGELGEVAAGGRSGNPPRHPERPEPSRTRPDLAALPRRRPQPPALPDPPRTRFLRSRTPALASPRDKRDQLRSAHPPPPPPGSVTSSLSPAPRPVLPAGRRAARLPLSPSPASRPLPGGTEPPSPVPSRCHRHSLRKTLGKPRSKQHRGGGAEGGGGTRDGEALSPRPQRSLPPASAARALTCSPRRPGRPRRRFPSRQGRGLAPPPPLAGRPEGAGASPAARAASVGEEETKQRRAGPRSAPRPRRPTDPQPPRRRRRHRARRGEQWWPPPSPRSGPPPSTPRFSSSPSASYRRHQDTRVRLPHPARSERSSPPHAAREGGGAAQPVTAASVKPGLAIYTRQGPTGPLAGQPASVAVSTLARPLSPNFYQTRLLRL
ncbi:basic salivary proline-rich protein 2-like [Neofelis nebulosa]|uniref:basic salivary proline-rich protein 2-like n=1 Tax=Neofelis nebulosa TaxID=61452 RepID=UPI00272B9AC6|nr:basic salivary proline-rich protein 2-like [Neofelis nebulosa]